MDSFSRWILFGVARNETAARIPMQTTWKTLEPISAAAAPRDGQ
jgi:hypothetical protein